MKSGLKCNPRQRMTVRSELIRPCVLMLTPPPHNPPPPPSASCLKWHRSCICVGLEEFSGACRRNEKCITRHHISCPRRSKAKCCWLPRPLVSNSNTFKQLASALPFHLLTSRTGKVFAKKKAPHRDANDLYKMDFFLVELLRRNLIYL